MSDLAVKVSEPIALKARLNEDWLAVVIGLLVFGSALVSITGIDLLGWAVKSSVYTDLARALSPFAKTYAWLGGGGALLATYAALLVVLSAGVATLGADVKKFAAAFTAVFAIAYASWTVGSYAHIAAVTPAEQQKFGIAWSLKLTNEGGYIVALLVGLVIANFLPRFAEWLKEAIRPELYIKIAIVILGATVAVTAAGRLHLASALLLRGAAAIVEAYLIYWAVIYYISRKWFGFSREWSVPLASGISICGVAAAIATGGAIRARPAVPILVSSLVVVFAVVEVLILPFLAQTFLWQEPLVAGAWVGLAIKTDGAAVAGGGITELLIMAKAAAEGIRYQPGWILGDHDDGEDLHRHLHRDLGVHSRLHLDQPHRQGAGQGETLGNLAALPEVHPRFHLRLCRLALARGRIDAGNCQGASCGGRRGQHLPGHLLHPDVLFDRRALGLPQALATGLRQACRGLFRQPVRICDLGRAPDLLAVLQRLQAAAGKLID